MGSTQISRSAKGRKVTAKAVKNTAAKAVKTATAVANGKKGKKGMKNPSAMTEELTANGVQLEAEKNTANEVPKGFKSLVDRMLERDKKLSLVLKLPNATSAEEIQRFWKELPDDRCTFDRGFGEALWACKDEVVWKLENAFRQRSLGNWAPYFAAAKDPDALEILNVLDALEVISQKMAAMNEEAKPIAMKVAESYFKDPSKFPAARVEDPRWDLLGFSPVTACLPVAVCGRIVAPLFKRKVCEQSADEKELTKLVSELEKLNCEYSRLYAFKLHEVENRYLDSHPEDEVED